jgi:sugar phosphate isomerase/epimerase
MLRLATKFLPEPVAFEQAYDAGFRHAELFLNADVLDRAVEVIAIARNYDMRYALHFPNRPGLEDSQLRACATLFEELQASAIVIHPPMLRQYEERMKAINPDLVLAIETMRVPKDEFLTWVSQHGAVTLDMEHIWMFTLPGSPIDEFFHLVRSIFQHHANCVKHVHMPGYLPGQGEHRPMYTSREFCLGVFDILAEYQYDGLVVSEVDMPFQNRFDLKMDVLLYENWLHQRSTGVSVSGAPSEPVV